MLEVHYFAGYRERLGLDRERLDWQPQLASVEQLRCGKARRLHLYAHLSLR